MIRYKQGVFEIQKHKIIIEYEDENQDDDVFPSKSTGVTLWPSSFVLSNFICNNSHLWKDKNVLELGSGLGLCGIVAQLYSSSVTLSDKDDHVLKIAEKNLSLNHIAEGTKTKIEKLTWGKDLEKITNKYDIIMGSDIIYSSSSVTLVWETVCSLLQDNKDSMFILSYVSRDSIFDSELVATAKNKNFSIESLSLSDLSQYYVSLPTSSYVSQNSLRCRDGIRSIFFI